MGGYVGLRSTQDTLYGYLYNWYAIKIFELAPIGSHIPNYTEIDELKIQEDILSNGDAGGRLKEAGYTHWNYPNYNATNASGFSGIASGIRHYDGDFMLKKSFQYFGSRTGDNFNGIFYTGKLSYDTSTLISDSPVFFNVGVSIRLIKTDAEDPSDIIDYDGNVYHTVLMEDAQYWTTTNFMCTHFNDGTPIAGPSFSNSEWAALTTPGYCINI
jgi:uncharacterized protein (TIGR02145 family)